MESSYAGGVFDPSTFDLDAYLGRIGFSGRPAATLDTLIDVARLHPAAIAFENLDPYLRRPVALDPAALQRKLVTGRRGGWCFEHNLLLGTALAALGFRPVGLGARVLWNAPAGIVGPRSHMVLLLDHAGTRYIVDAGFGGLTLTAPLRLEADVEQTTPHETFRLRRLDDDFAMEADLGGGSWRPLYRFDLQAQRPADYDVSNWYLCNHPQSHFLAGIIAARSAPGRRYALRGAELTTYEPGGVVHRRALQSAGEIRETLEQTFGIAVPEGADVDAALARMAP
jgi:N-hydroxyarylamine O-acetyltransferase